MSAAEQYWFVATPEGNAGPFLGRTIRSSGVEVSPQTLVWSDGMGEWAPCSETPLAALLFGAPPTLPTPPPLIAENIDRTSPPAPAATNTSSPGSYTPGGDEPSKPASRSYIARHWRGELPLWQSYWLSCIAVTAGVGVIANVLLSLPSTVRGTSAAFLVFMAFSLPPTVWQFWGLYRSLRTAREKRTSGAAGLALGWIGLSIFAVSFTSTFALKLLPQAAEHWSIVTGDKGIAPMQLTLLPSGREIELSGQLPAGSAAEFERTLKTMPGVKILHVNSGGGRVKEAARIAELVRARGMKTYVSAACHSAGTVIFLAGEERYIGTGAKVGFHSVSFPGFDADDLADLQTTYRQLLLAAGVEREFVDRVSRTPSSEFWYPSVSEMYLAGVLTHLSSEGQFGYSAQLFTDASIADFRKGLLATPIIKAVETVYPEDFEFLAKETFDGIRSGKTESEIQAITRRVVMEAFTKAVLRARDAELVQLIDLRIQVLRQLGPKIPVPLLGWLRGETSTTLYEVLSHPDYPQSEEHAIMTAVIESSVGRPEVLPVPERVKAVIKEKLPSILASASDETILALSAYAEASGTPEHQAKGLEELYVAFRGVLSESDLANLVRCEMYGVASLANL